MIGETDLSLDKSRNVPLEVDPDVVKFFDRVSDRRPVEVLEAGRLDAKADDGDAKGVRASDLCGRKEAAGSARQT